ncbi:arsenate reductase (glutaredoxin) [Sneathiella aquimaris]|uniref:arsenate reductase (glutaredoxin) n=1 Tax=Sneathiella aquimaris TaxID=2599305 RepID=UPI00146BE7AD|nr:arsenate reductase (glutaredoxin) [Sneathiella aquimaris]
MSVKILHNPRCSKSRQTLDLIREKGIEPLVIEYLKTPPTKQELTEILSKLGIKPRDLMRKGEAEYKENSLSDPSLSDEQLIDAMVAIPKLIERPIVLNGDKVRIGRPPESVLEIL